MYNPSREEQGRQGHRAETQPVMWCHKNSLNLAHKWTNVSRAASKIKEVRQKKEKKKKQSWAPSSIIANRQQNNFTISTERVGLNTRKLKLNIEGNAEENWTECEWKINIFSITIDK